MTDFKTAVAEFKDMSLFEKIFFAFFILVLLGALSALMFSSGPMVPVVNYINYQQALLLQKVFGGNLVYYGKLTIVFICLVSSIPFAIVKYLRKARRND